jgi:hypothetical protein
MLKVRLAVLALLCGAVMLATPSAGASPRAVTRTWMVSSTSVRLINSFTGGTNLAKSAFDLPTTVETGLPASGWVTERTATFTAYGPATTSGSLLYALAHKRIAAGTKYLLYDNEDWSLTPRNERSDPSMYMIDFVEAAHAAGYKAILAPAIDLARSMTCYKTADDAAVNYVQNCSIPKLAGVAKPDIYEVQAQLYEADASLGVLCDCYDWLVLQSVLESRAAAPIGTLGLTVIAGLSTNQNGKVTTPQVLQEDTDNTTPANLAAAVNGYWLNVPEKSKACPSCVPGGAPQVAVGYLELLGYSS